MTEYITVLLSIKLPKVKTYFYNCPACCHGSFRSTLSYMLTHFICLHNVAIYSLKSLPLLLFLAFSRHSRPNTYFTLGSLKHHEVTSKPALIFHFYVFSLVIVIPCSSFRNGQLLQIVYRFLEYWVSNDALERCHELVLSVLMFCSVFKGEHLVCSFLSCSSSYLGAIPDVTFFVLVEPVQRDFVFLW